MREFYILAPKDAALKSFYVCLVIF